MNRNTIMAHPDGFQFSSDAELAAIPIPKSKRLLSESKLEPSKKTLQMIPVPNPLILGLPIMKTSDNSMSFDVPQSFKFIPEITLRFEQSKQVFEAIKDTNVKKLVFNGNLKPDDLQHFINLIRHFKDLNTVEYNFGNGYVANPELLDALIGTKITELKMNRLIDLKLDVYFNAFQQIPTLISVTIKEDNIFLNADSDKFDLIREYLQIRKSENELNKRKKTFNEKLHKKEASFKLS